MISKQWSQEGNYNFSCEGQSIIHQIEASARYRIASFTRFPIPWSSVESLKVESLKNCARPLFCRDYEQTALCIFNFLSIFLSLSILVALARVCFFGNDQSLFKLFFIF